MSYTIEMVEDPDPVRVGTTGTIGSLMFRELESIRRMEQQLGKTSNARKPSRSDSVSISCARPLASLAGYRLSIGTRKQAQDSNPRHRFYEDSTTPRSSNVDMESRRSISKEIRRTGSKNVFESGDFEPPTCRSKLGYGRQESLTNSGSEVRRVDCLGGKPMPRKSVSLDGTGAAAAFAGMFGSEEDNLALTPGRLRKDREFRTPMLRSDGKEGETEDGALRSGRKSTEKRGVQASVCSFVEVVDLKCNNNDKIWGSPIANRLRRLSFSKLSDSVN